MFLQAITSCSVDSSYVSYSIYAVDSSQILYSFSFSELNEIFINVPEKQ